MDWSQPAASHSQSRARLAALARRIHHFPRPNPAHLEIARGRPADAPAGPAAGRISAVKPLVVSCGSGALELIEVQLEGRKRISAADFANGQRLAENEDIGGVAPLNLPLGYAYAATYAGIRQVEKDDLALIVTGLPANAAAVFTQNRVQAAPVKLCRRHLKLSGGLVGAILVNAGNANCATRTGDAVALATSKAAAKLLKLPVSQVLPASTGVIGVELDPRKIIDALPRLVSGPRHRSLRRRGPRHHDHRPGAQDRLRRNQPAARRGADRGHDQRLGHDPAAHGHHPGVRHDRRLHSRRRNCAPC